MYLAADERDLKKIVQAVIRLLRVRSGIIEITADAASTSVTDPTVTENSIILLIPLNQETADEYSQGLIYIDEADHLRGSFVVTHANDPSTTRKLHWVAFGD